MAAITSVLVAGIGVGVVWVVGVVDIAARLADPEALAALVGINCFFGMLRLVVAHHAWRAGGGHNLLAGLVLGALVLVPHAALNWMGLEARRTLTGVFAGSDAGEVTRRGPPPMTTVLALPSSTTTTEETTTTASTTTTTSQTTTTSEDRQETDVTIPPTTTTSTVPFDGRRINMLLLGGDAGPGRGGLRTDTMMVASLDPVSGDAAIFGIPRNFGGFTFSDGSGYPGNLLNSVYGWGRRHPDAFGGIDPGASATIDVIEHITGLDIEYYLLVDLTGFADVVDAFGGVRITVPKPVYGPFYNPATGGYEMIRIPAGEQTLSGGEALAYSRARYGSSDYARMGRQRCVLSAMAAQSDPLSLLMGLDEILEVIDTHITTNLPIDAIPDLIRLLSDVDSEEIRVVGFDSRSSVGRTAAGALIPDVEEIRRVISLTLSDPSSVSDVGVVRAGEACS